MKKLYNNDYSLNENGRKFCEEVNPIVDMIKQLVETTDYDLFEVERLLKSNIDVPLAIERLKRQAGIKSIDITTNND